jgi:hypothetical protein
VWVKLYIGDELSGDAFAVEKLRNVSAFKEAVKEYCQEILTSVAANQLKVYDRAGDHPTNPLAGNLHVPPATYEAPLNVVAPHVFSTLRCCFCIHSCIQFVVRRRKWCRMLLLMRCCSRNFCFEYRFLDCTVFGLVFSPMFVTQLCLQSSNQHRTSDCAARIGKCNLQLGKHEIPKQ